LIAIDIPASSETQVINSSKVWNIWTKWDFLASCLNTGQCSTMNCREWTSRRQGVHGASYCLWTVSNKRGSVSTLHFEPQWPLEVEDLAHCCRKCITGWE